MRCAFSSEIAFMSSPLAPPQSLQDSALSREWPRKDTSWPTSNWAQNHSTLWWLRLVVADSSSPGMNSLQKSLLTLVPIYSAHWYGKLSTHHRHRADIPWTYADLSGTQWRRQFKWRGSRLYHTDSVRDINPSLLNHIIISKTKLYLYRENPSRQFRSLTEDA